MPTLEERKQESKKNLKARLEKRSLEMGITYSFSEYIEMMETYLLELERRVTSLEKRQDSENNNTPTDKNQTKQA
ncbi:MAG: hypothetical protein U9P10_12410 [Thermodesulfobacteriota bacterium]|nr:hypothetical protein [Thermodesulfobacteriota bacterium]